MAPFVSSLREGLENKNHNVLTPDGGLFMSLFDVLLGQSEHIDLYIDRDGTFSSLRVIPRLDEITEDPERPGVYFLTDATGIFLDEKDTQTDNMVSVSGIINTNVTQASTLSGVVRLGQTHHLEEEVQA